MDIKTKFNINDIAFLLAQGKIVEVQITEIHINIYPKRTSIIYEYGSILDSTKAEEVFLFKTKEDLIQDLLDRFDNA
jgi:hypothetical protein